MRRLVARVERYIRQNGMPRSGRTKLHFKVGHLFLVLSLVLFCIPDCAGYSILTHEAIIDAAWKDRIDPLLLKRFPNAKPEDLLKAHAYVYGGAIIQDLGYYPFGSRFFSDLTHYVRSGDFVVALIEESRDLNEYAFALARWRTTPLTIRAIGSPRTFRSRFYTLDWRTNMGPPSLMKTSHPRI